MDLKCQDFHFKSNSIYGSYNSEAKIDSITNRYYTDLTDHENSIRIFGTEKEIDNALDDYMKGKSIYLDECYDFKIEKRGTFWGDFYGDELEKYNHETQKKLDKYKNIYKEKNKAIIIKLI